MGTTQQHQILTEKPKPPMDLLQHIRQESREFFQRVANLHSNFTQAWNDAGLNQGFDQLLTEASVRLLQSINEIAADILQRDLPLDIAKDIRNAAPPEISVNCTDPRYSHALSGKLQDPRHPKIIVDLTLFGWDVDFLELRLLEYKDLIDSFVVVEQNVSFKVVGKPFFVPQLMRGRLRQFADKIDYLPQSFPESITLGRRPFPRRQQFMIEDSMRRYGFRHINQKYLNTTAFKNVYVLQNDGDEFITRSAMAHFKYCALKQPQTRTQFHPFQFKRNPAWVQMLHPTGPPMNLFDLKQGGLGPLRRIIWQLGPHILPLNQPITQKNFRVEPKWGSTHMGLGAAAHFSNPSHHLYSFLKLFSTVDARPPKDFPQGFWEKAAAGKLSEVDMRSLSFQCATYTLEKQPWLSLLDSTVFNNRTRTFVLENLPWAVRKTGRYPWLFREEGFLEAEVVLYECICLQKGCDDPRLV